MSIGEDQPVIDRDTAFTKGGRIPFEPLLHGVDRQIVSDEGDAGCPSIQKRGGRGAGPAGIVGQDDVRLREVNGPVEKHQRRDRLRDRLP